MKHNNFVCSMMKEEFCSFDFPTHSLQLDIHRYGQNSIEFELANKNYVRQEHQKLKQFLILLMLFGFYCALAKLGAHNGTKLFQRTLMADIGFIAYLIYLTISTLKIVKKEKLLFCYNFAMQLETQRIFSRSSSVFISASNIYDVRINEVIENLEVHYILIARTKGELFKEKPIIALFNNQKPPINCLELIYKNLNLILCKSNEMPAVI